MAQMESTKQEDKTAFQKEWEEAIDIEDARERSLRHVDELLANKEAEIQLSEKNYPLTFRQECEQGYSIEEARNYVLSHLHSIQKK